MLRWRHRDRRFLCMHLINPPLLLVPPPDIDAFWHQHILFTREYARDCERLFGGFLHHSPASGEAGEAAAMQQGARETAKFYADAFGEHYFATEPEGFASNWLECPSSDNLIRIGSIWKRGSSASAD